jgi:polysaccharide deacetylase family protein (PEP-CTERM system associated)
VKNVLTIDVEDWYQTKDFDFNYDTWNNYESRIEDSLGLLLDMLAKNNVRGTFFILGYIAKQNPELVKKIHEQGHHIGSHGCYHELAYRQSPEEFRKDARNSKKILEDIVGKEISYFRSSSWSIGSENLWALEILEEEGYKVDSSLQPFKTPLSGMKKGPIEPFHPIVNGRKLELLEFPPTVLPIGNVRLPFSGGFYLRAVPLPIIKLALRMVNTKREAMIYTHPWEYDCSQPRIATSIITKFVHYYNISKTQYKLDNLIQNYEFTTMEKVVNSKKYEWVKIH